MPARIILPEPEDKGLKSYSDKEINRKVEPKQIAITPKIIKFNISDL